MKVFYFIVVFSLISSCVKKGSNSSVQIKKLNYPSASTVEYVNGKLYVMGDDATKLLVLDTNFNVIDSIPIILFVGKRIPKDIKPDIESSALNIGSNGSLFLFGSMSVSPYRDQCWRYDWRTGKTDSMSLESLHTKIKNARIEQINIEGACNAFGYLVMANRGNKSYPKNHLLIGLAGVWKTDTTNYHNITTIPIVTNNDTTTFSGISGLCYTNKSNKLIMSVSTEDTKNVYEDGAIGKSYLWIINDFSIKREDKTISPDRIIDLEKIDKRFKGYKIESVTVISETIELLNLVLVADNDDGSSTIFKMSINKD